MLARLYLAALAFSCLSSEVQSIPLPPEIQKLICKFAGMKSLEDSTVEKLCEKAQELFPSLKFDPDCKTVVEELWDTGLAVFCPEPSQVGVTALPVPPFLEKLVCQAASRKEVENSTVEAVCAKVHEVFPQAQFDPDCETVMDEFWEAGLALCPASREAAMPSPQDIGRLICEVASAEEIEDHAVDAVCAKITAVFPSLEFDPDCKTMLEEIWDSAEAMCPKRRERALPSPEELEKLICEVASSKEIEEHAVEAVCAKIVAEFPKIKFVPDCNNALDSIWVAVVAECPHSRSTAEIVV